MGCEYLLLNESPSCNDDDKGKDCNDMAVEEVELLSSNNLAVLSLQYIAPVHYPPTLVLHWVRGVAIGGTYGSGVRAAPCLRWRGGGSIRQDMRHATRIIQVQSANCEFFRDAKLGDGTDK
jgi:hypothetical protein